MLYSECWDDLHQKRPFCEQIFDRLDMISQLVMPSKHPFSDVLSSKYQEELLKGKSQSQIANSIKEWLAHYGWYQQHYLVKGLQDHIDCGQCCWLTGFFYAYNISIESDLEQAIYWYKLSVERNNAVAQNSLGYYYQNGIGVEKDVKKAVELYQNSAEQGHVTAQNNLGYCYQHGIGVEKDAKKAAELYQNSAEQGAC